MLNYEHIFIVFSLNRQKFVFIPLLVIGCLIYVYLLYGCIWSNERLRHDFYISSAFNLNSKSNTTRLIAMGTSSFKSAPLFCRNENGQAIKAQVIDMGGSSQCLWWNFFVDCEFNELPKQVTLFGATADEIRMDITLPSAKSYKLVVCFSRMFYYENWPIALLTIELYRKYGVELLSIPIISVIKDLYTILKHYEQHNIVSLRKGVVLPRIIDINYNPNYESEFFNQIISTTECLYEYKQSEFILFGDLDDVIIPKSYPTLHEELISLSQQYPLVSSFEFRWTRFNIEMSKSPKDYNIEQTIERVEFEEMRNAGKTIGIPSRLNTGLMHHPYLKTDIEGNYTHKFMGPNDMLTIHLREQFIPLKGHSKKAYFQSHNFNGLTERLHQFLSLNETVFKVFEVLPQEQLYFPLMVECYSSIVKRLEKGRQLRCPNALYCKPYKEPKRECVVLSNTYESAYIGNGLTVHRAKSSQLIESQSCYIGEINDAIYSLFNL